MVGQPAGYKRNQPALYIVTDCGDRKYELEKARRMREMILIVHNYIYNWNCHFPWYFHTKICLKYFVDLPNCLTAKFKYRAARESFSRLDQLKVNWCFCIKVGDLYTKRTFSCTHLRTWKSYKSFRLSFYVFFS